MPLRALALVQHVVVSASQNGTILLKGHLDREQKDSYTLFITATDHAQKDKTRSVSFLKWQIETFYSLFQLQASMGSLQPSL